MRSKTLNIALNRYYERPSGPWFADLYREINEFRYHPEEAENYLCQLYVCKPGRSWPVE